MKRDARTLCNRIVKKAEKKKASGGTFAVCENIPKAYQEDIQEELRANGYQLHFGNSFAFWVTW